MPGKTLMVQGTASHVGKSVIVAALCRILREDGLRVAPFKAQNMALNSFVTQNGGEIGRAQAAQAEACGIQPHVDMNPILMKPFEDTKAQIIFLGKPVGNMTVAEYANFKRMVFPAIVECLNHLREKFDVVVIEGAGSPAEINLKDQDIVNMKIAKAARSPVILAGDIDRGGVFASLIGTLHLLEFDERERISALLINKFRGDPSLLREGLEVLEQRTGKSILGVIPYFHDLRIAQEDSREELQRTGPAAQKIAIRVLLLRHLSNFTDFDALRDEPDVDVRYACTPEECAGADLLIIPGSKSTVADFLDLQHRGFVSVLRSRASHASVLGICAGFQMLCEQIFDRKAIESPLKEVQTFGLIPGVTEFDSEKFTRQVAGNLFRAELPVRGYEIHHGSIRLRYSCTPFFSIREPDGSFRNEGYRDSGAGIYGTSIHGVFDEPLLRRWFLNLIREKKGWNALSPASDSDSDLPYRSFAAHVRNHINIGLLYKILNQE